MEHHVIPNFVYRYLTPIYCVCVYVCVCKIDTQKILYDLKHLLNYRASNIKKIDFTVL